MSRERGEHSLVVFKRQLTRAGFLQPDDVTRAEVRLSQQLADLARRQRIDDVVNALEVDSALGEQSEQLATGRARRLFINREARFVHAGRLAPDTTHTCPLSNGRAPGTPCGAQPLSAPHGRIKQAGHRHRPLRPFMDLDETAALERVSERYRAERFYRSRIEERVQPDV